ncbi:triple helix repeat-containing collagen [Methylorubrum populi]|uniref:Triple helix repeat-containing collagen n=1 Tax=Methylorubrum populi TaxID=223967 RepID=A0A160PJY7_9HYPH|nr:Hint domain-containing protein [Methylorubrum populi]BAU92441.1 triple helix repeat-containing collagen [Methylorubrum populi]
MAITFNNTVYQPGFFGTDDGGVPASGSFRIDDVYSFPVTVNGTVTNAGDPVTLTYTLPGSTTPTSQTLTATALDNSNMILFTGGSVPGSLAGGTNRFVFSNTQLFGSGDPNRTTFADDGNRTLGAYAPVCFTTGTLIRTSRGDVAVEDLQVGDIAVTASGGLRPITWIGHRAMKAAGAALPFHQQPVRVRAGAFGGGLPTRDLSLSPGHPVLVGADAGNEGGVLVPVMCLINGTTITREPVTSVTYWHVELDGHDILLAEGLPAESYIDGGDRAFFSEASDHALHNPDFVPAGWNARCRPVAVDGPSVEAERQRLDAVFAGALSEQCAWDAESGWAA